MRKFRKTTVEDEQKKAVEGSEGNNKDDGEIRVFKERRKAGVSAKGEIGNSSKHGK